MFDDEISKGAGLMNKKERVNAVLNRKPIDRNAFWMGCPTQEAKEIYYRYFEVATDEELSSVIGDDFVWISADENSWKHPEGKPMFDFLGGKERVSLNQEGVFAECESIKEVEKYDWPDAKYLDFTHVIKKIDEANERGVAVFSGLWSPFFHDITNFFGMENCFIKMITNPEVVEAVVDRVIEFYLQANKKFFELTHSKIDSFFFGNDFGSQEDLLISPELFKKFVLPGFKKLTQLSKSYDIKVTLHSCGSIKRVIPLLIEAGVDALHPLQAKAKGMDAESLSKEYSKDLVFIGGVDTQELLPFGTPEQIKNEVRRLKKVFGQNFIVSPSHEALLSNVSPQNLVAMRDATME